MAAKNLMNIEVESAAEFTAGPAVIDRLFKTRDFFVIFELADLDLASRAFFGV